MQKADLRLLSRQTMALANAVAYYAEKEAEKVMYLRNAIECIEMLINAKEILERSLNDNYQ